MLKKVRLFVYKYDTIQLAVTNQIISNSRHKVNLFVCPLIQVCLIDTNSGAAKPLTHGLSKAVREGFSFHTVF